MSAIKQYWPLVMGSLKKSLSKSHFDAWFTNLEFVGTQNQGRKLVIRVPSTFNKSYIEKKFKPDLLEAVSKYYPNVIHIDFEIQEIASKNTLNQDEVFPIQQDIEDIEGEIARVKKQEIQFKPGLALQKNLHNLNSKYTFENFITTKSNQLAVSVAKAIVESPGKRYNPAFIYSGVGLGKTHLLQAIGHSILASKPGMRIRYTTCETFFNLFIQGVQNRKSNDFVDYYRSIDVLLIDDIQFIRGKEATQEAFFHTFNELHQNNKQIVITSDKSPKDLEGLEERLISRFEWGIVVDISKPELEDKISVLKDKVDKMSLDLSLEQITLIATSVTTNYRDLEGVLNRIEARIKLLPNLPLENYELNKILAGFHKAAPINIQVPQQLSTGVIIDSVCKYYNLEKSEILSKSRTSHLVLARQVAMYLCKLDLELSFPVIAKVFGKDHTTILHAFNSIKKKSESDSALAKKILIIQKSYKELDLY